MRKSVSVACFSWVSSLRARGIVRMGASERVRLKSWFAKGRY